MSLLDQPEFREWFRTTHHMDLNPQPELRLDDCDDCGSSGVPVLIDHCLVCLASDFGVSMVEQRIADAIRTFIHVFVSEPPDAGHRLISQILFRLAEAACDIADATASGDEGTR